MATQSGSIPDESVAGNAVFPTLVGRQQKGNMPLGLTLTPLVATPNLENTHFPNTFCAMSSSLIPIENLP